MQLAIGAVLLNMKQKVHSSVQDLTPHMAQWGNML